MLCIAKITAESNGQEMEHDMETGVIYEPWPKLLKRGYIGDYIGEYHRGLPGLFRKCWSVLGWCACVCAESALTSFMLGQVPFIFTLLWGKSYMFQNETSLHFAAGW